MTDDLPQESDKLFSLLGLCRKANKLLHGFELSAEAVKDGRAALVIITKDTSPKTAKEVKYLVAREAGTVEETEIIELAATQDDIQKKTGRRAGVLAITDKGLAAAVIKELAHGKRAVEEDNTW